MDYISNKAQEIVRFKIQHQISQSSEIIEKVRYDLMDILEPQDQAKYLSIILEANENAYKQHQSVCSNKSNCRYDKEYISVSYLLTQELKKIGQIPFDQFTYEEKFEAENKLDKLLEELQTLKDSNEILFNELQELKELFYLGKKNWKQQFLGKVFDMTASGVVSETVSKKIIEFLNISAQIVLNG